jgi:hypothetical protein
LRSRHFVLEQKEADMASTPLAQHEGNVCRVCYLRDGEASINASLGALDEYAATVMHLTNQCQSLPRPFRSERRDSRMMTQQNFNRYVGWGPNGRNRSTSLKTVRPKRQAPLKCETARRVFNLADYVEVKGASFEGGLLKIDLVREVPEAMKPRRIAINAGNDNKTIEHKRAA